MATATFVKQVVRYKDANGVIRTFDALKGDNTPVRGVDYWTAADVASLTQAAINAVLQAYPAAEEESF